MGNKPTTLPPASNNVRKSSHSTGGSNGLIQSSSNGCIQTSNPEAAVTLASVSCRRQKFTEKDFLVCGIDYLPDFEKRKVRRRGSRKFLKLESFSWTASYLQFLSRARASLRASADSAVFCTSTPHAASSVESIPRLAHHQHNTNHHILGTEQHHIELSDQKYLANSKDNQNNLPCNRTTESHHCCQQGGQCHQMLQRDLENQETEGAFNSFTDRSINQRVCFRDETSFISHIVCDNSVRVDIKCTNSETNRTSQSNGYIATSNSSQGKVLDDITQTPQLNGFITVSNSSLKMNGKVVNPSPTIEIETSDVVSIPLLARSTSRDDRVDGRLVFAGRFVPARDGGMECELSRNVDSSTTPADDTLSRSVPDIFLRPLQPKHRPSVCSMTSNSRKDSTCVGEVSCAFDGKLTTSVEFTIESNPNIAPNSANKGDLSNNNTEEQRNKEKQNGKNLKPKNDKRNKSVGYSVDNSTTEIFSSDDGIFLSRAATCDSGIDVVANGRSSPSDSDWKQFSAYPYENVIMSGGGSKGYAYIGALKALEDCGVLRNVKRIAGSSAGAICAGLLAVGCTPQEIADVFKCDIKWLFHDQTCACCCCIPRVCRKYGIHPARRFHEIYGEHIARKVNDPDITFGQLQRLYGRELCIVVTNLSRMCSEYCTPTTAPDMPIRDAVRMSMAFPVVFRAVRYNLTGRECLYADGGILDQYPVHCFDDVGLQEVNQNKLISSADESSLSSSTQLEFNDKTIGLYVVSEKAMDYKIWKTLFGQEIPYKPTYLPNTRLARNRLKHELSVRKRLNKEFSKKEYMDELKATVGDAVEMFDHYEVLNKSHIDIHNISEYFVAAIETLLISQRQLHVKPQDVNRTVAINCGYIGTNDYVIEPGDREFMINQGYACTRRFLNDFINNVRQRATPTSSTLLPTTLLDPIPRGTGSFSSKSATEVFLEPRISDNRL